MRLASRREVAIAVVAVVVSLAAVAKAQTPEVPAPSPKARVEQRVGVTDFAIDYSSPGVKGRKIWGQLVPYDKVWRTGANAATKLTASRDFTFGGKAVKAGAYAVITIPAAKGGWTVIPSSNLAGGAMQYDDKADVVKITVKPAAIPLRERLTFLFSDTSDDGMNLDLEWEKVRIRVPITVDTKTQVMASIETATKDAWRPHFVSARYLLESNGDLDKALGFIDQSIEIRETWWNHWIKAQVLAKQGKKGDAVATADKAIELGKGDPVFEGSFKEEVTKTKAGWK